MWWNFSYVLMQPRDLLEIPLATWLKPNALVAVWVTNNPAIRTFVLQELLPSWSCEPVATWYWLKVTPNGQMVFPLKESMQATRRPYEVVILGRARVRRDDEQRKPDTQQIVDHQVICAVPGKSRSLHSSFLIRLWCYLYSVPRRAFKKTAIRRAAEPLCSPNTPMFGTFCSQFGEGLDVLWKRSHKISGPQAVLSAEQGASPRRAGMTEHTIHSIS